MLLFSWIPCAAQDFKADMEKMYQVYKNLTNFSLKVDIRVYEASLKSTPVMVRKASICKQNHNFLITLDKLTMLNTDSLGLIIDTEEKTITCNPPGSGNPQPALAVTGLDSLLKRVDSVKYIGTGNSLKHYIVYTGNKVIKQTDLYFSSADNRIVKIIYDYNYDLMKQYTKVLIEYSAFNSAPLFPANYFSLSKYIVYEKNKIKPASNYQQYELQLNF